MYIRMSNQAGNFAFGYSNPLSHREESGNVETGVVRWGHPLSGEEAINKTLPEAQRIQGIDSLTWVISPAK